MSEQPDRESRHSLEHRLRQVQKTLGAPGVPPAARLKLRQIRASLMSKLMIRGASR